MRTATSLTREKGSHIESALGWIGAIVEWFGQFLPRWTVVDTVHAWVKWRKGTDISSGGAGIVWHWPAVSILKVYPVARQALDLRAQTLSTKEGKTVLVGGLLTFRVNDIERALTQTWDLDETVKDTALTAIHAVITKLTFDEIKAGEQDGSLNKSLRSEARKVLDTYGIFVIKLSLTDLAPTRVIKLAMTTDVV